MTMTRKLTSPAAVAAIRGWNRADAAARTARTAAEKRAAAARRADRVLREVPPFLVASGADVHERAIEGAAEFCATYNPLPAE